MMTPTELYARLDAVFEELEPAVAAWHDTEPDLPALLAREDGLDDFVMGLHAANFALWHVEDEARRIDVDDAVIADCKRRIDALNQTRNDRIEAVDAWLMAVIAEFLPPDAADRHNTETIGQALDRLSILALKIFHMAEQTRREDAGPEHIEKCRSKLDVMRIQQADLARAVRELAGEYAAGSKRPRVYHQFKMYNDPTLNPALYAPGGQRGS
jgi:hypothetical protein